MTMVGSTARPGARHGDVSEEPRRWLLMAVLIAALVPTTHAVCAVADDQRCRCTSLEKIDCDLDGDYPQVPSFQPSDTVYSTILLHGESTSTSFTIQTEAFKNIKAKSIEFLFKGKITLIPGAFSGVGNELEYLKFRYTLETIPDGVFDGLDQLRDLHLSHNHMTTVSQRTFGHLPRLEGLYLYGNQLETIHDEAFDGLKELRNLRLARNRLKTVSRTMFRQLSHLKTLRLDENQLETIHDGAFDGLSKLEFLDLDKNRLKEVRNTTFSHLSNLKTLFIEFNELETIPGDTFDGLRKLQWLSLRENRLKTVSHTMFSHLSRLVALFLGHNQLETIPDDTCLGLGQLKYLVMNNNRLTSLNGTLISHLSHLSDLVLDNNPLMCDCRLAWVQATASKVTVRGVCTSPPTAKDQSITSYDVSQCNPGKPTNAGIGIVSSIIYLRIIYNSFRLKTIYTVYFREQKATAFSVEFQ